MAVELGSLNPLPAAAASGAAALVARLLGPAGADPGDGRIARWHIAVTAVKGLMRSRRQAATPRPPKARSEQTSPPVSHQHRDNLLQRPTRGRPRRRPQAVLGTPPKA
jgi:hypothetical protein